MSTSINALVDCNSLRQNIKYWTKLDYIGQDSLIGKLKFTACKIFLKLFPDIDLEKRHKRKKLLYVLADVLIETAVLLTFMYSEFRADEYKETFYDVFRYLPYLRLERLTWIVGIFGIWLVFLVLILILPTISLCFLMISALLNHKIHIRFQNILIYIPLHLIDSFLQVAIISHLIEGVKYGMNSDTSYIYESSFGVSISSRDIAIVYILFLFLNFSLNYISKLVMTEFRHDLISLIPYAKTGIRLDLYKGMMIHLFIISYYNLIYDHAWLHYLICFLGSGFMWLLYYIHHPYYKERLNLLFSGQFSVLGFAALGHLIGELMENIQVSFILSIVVTPFIVMIGCVCISSKYRRMKDELIDDIYSLNNEIKLELLLRPYLLTKSPEAANVFKILHKNPIMKESRLLCLLDSYYTFVTQNNKTLARVKFSMQTKSSASFEREYQEFRCRKLLNNDNNSVTLRFMKFCRLLLQTQIYDKSLCYLLKDLWSNLSLQKPKPKLIRSQVVKIQDCLGKATAGYTALIERYPTRHCLYQHYGTLLSSICNDTFKYNEYLQKSEFLKNEFIKSTHLDSLNLFHPNSGILIVTCHPSIFGRIVYANEEALKILEFDYINLIGTFFTDLIPDIFKKYHTNYMKNLLKKRENTSVQNHPGILYYLTSQHFIVPVQCRIEIDAYGNYPCFIVSIAKCLIPTPVALLSNNGDFLSHSKDFGTHIGSKLKYLTNDNIFDLVPRLTPESVSIKVNSYELRIVKNIFHNFEIDLAVLYSKAANLPEYYKSLIFCPAIDSEAEIQKSIVDKKTRFAYKVRISEYSQIIDDDYKLERSKCSNTIEELDRLYDMNSKSLKNKQIIDKSVISASSSLKSKSNSFEIRNKQFIRHLQENIRNLKIVIGISFLLFILSSIAISAIISQSVKKSLDIGVLDDMMNNVKLNMHILWYNARDLDISTRQNYLHINTEEVYQEINTCINDFEDLLSELKSFSDTYDLQEFYEQIFLIENISVWNIYNSTQTTEKINFINLIRSYISHSKNVIEVDTAKLSLLQPDLYYLYQNPLADSTKACNFTINSVRDHENEYVMDMRLYLIYCIASISGIIIGSAVFITNRCIQVQRSSDKIWSLIYCISNAKLRELQKNAIDRLSTTHKVDIERDTNFSTLLKK